MRIEEFETVKRWLNAVHADHTGSSKTTESYLRWFKRFVEWLGKTPDQLIAERKEQLKSEDETIKWKAEETLRDFCNHLEREEGSSRGTVLAYHSAVKSFYRYNHFRLQLRTPKKHAPRGVKPHTHEEIKAIYDVSDVRDRAVVLALAESGMSRADFVKLTYEHVRRDYEKHSDTIYLDVVRGKEQVKYDTFLGINATKALRTYVEMRKAQGEQIDDDTILFPSKKGGGMFTPNGVNWLLRRLGEKANVTTSPHRFRKFFETNMGTKATSLLVKHWMGHSLGVERSYFVPSVEEQRKAYLEAYNKIDILKTGMTEREVKLQALRTYAESLGLDQIRIEAKCTTIDEKIEAHQKAIAETRKRENLDRFTVEKRYVTEEEDCQRIVNESELEKWLAKGWHVEAVLPSGKIVVSNE